MTRKLILRVYVNSRDAEETGFFLWERNFGSSIVRTINWNIRCPALIYALTCKTAQIIINGVSRPIIFVEKCLKVLPWCSMDFSPERAAKWGRLQILDFRKEVFTSLKQLAGRRMFFTIYFCRWRIPWEFLLHDWQLRSRVKLGVVRVNCSGCSSSART